MSIRIGFVASVRLIGTMLVLLAGAWAASGEAKEGALRRIVYCDNSHYPPFSMIDSKGRPAGFNIDLIRAIGREAGIDVEIRLMSWSQVRSALETERSVDMSAMFYSAERDRIFDFTVPHAAVVYEIFLRRGSQGADSVGKLRGKKVLVEDRSYAAEYLSANHPEIDLIRVDSEPEALRILASGNGDAAIASQSGGFYYIAQAGLRNLAPADLPVLPVSYSFAVPHGRQELIDEINRGLARVRRSGEYTKLYSKWFGLNPPGLSAGIPWRYVAAGGASLLVLSAAILAWIWSLRRQVAEKTGRFETEWAQRQHAEHCLRESEANLQTILDHSTALISRKDLDGRYLVVNRVFEEVVGRDRSEIVGRTDWDLFSQDLARTSQENDRKVLNANIPMMFEERTEARGTILTFLNVKFPIRDTSGVPKGLGAIATDISERKRFEQEIQTARQAAERNSRAKDHFLAVLSHELRTPLTPVLAAVTEALSRDLPEELRSMLQMIRRNIELEARLIDDLLDLTRLARGKLSLTLRTSNAHDLFAKPPQFVPRAWPRDSRMSASNSMPSILMSVPIRHAFNRSFGTCFRTRSNSQPLAV